ncbi:hypothetical protein EV646_10684 [Kribbella antiqua]|uniref:Uncharacterized protein n=1 Tax=Kribbella antiqua TaxID=2512217 RepID=A0A4R2IV37_9ACTN|nr:hypothetical protein EV646_10684 [Kribbella antiqua]
MQAGGRPIVYGADAHQVLKDLVAPSLRKRLGRQRAGEAGAQKELHDNFMARRRVLVDSVRAVVGAPDSPHCALKNAFADAWTAVHADRMIDDLCDNGYLPPDVRELKLGWNEADPEKRQQLLNDIHWSAPRAYAFAEAVGEPSAMSVDQTLQMLANVPAFETSLVAADLLMSGRESMPYALKMQVADLIRTEFDNETDGRHIAELALELINTQEPVRPYEDLVAVHGDLVRDPTRDVAPASGAPTAKPASSTGRAAAGSQKPDKGKARE